MRVLTTPAETGAVTLSLPQDVQTEAFTSPDEFLASACGTSAVHLRELGGGALARLAESSRRAGASAHRCGGGVTYDTRNEALRRLRSTHRLPVSETQAGKGSLPFDQPAVGRRDRGHRHERRERARARGRPHHRIGTRWTDFTTDRKALFRPDARSPA